MSKTHAELELSARSLLQYAAQPTNLLDNYESRPGSRQASPPSRHPQTGGGNQGAVRDHAFINPNPSSTTLSEGAAGTTLASGSFSSGQGAEQYQPGDEELQPCEIVVERNGEVRQAGASQIAGEYTKRYRVRAEQSLYVFIKGVVGLFFLTPHFHRKICNWVQVCPPFRKLLIMPREHVKTGIMSNGLPQHILIQPAATNIYFPGMEGSECRILLSGETANMAEKNLRVIETSFEENKLVRAFWPHRVWHGRAKSESKMWNNQGMIIPRKTEWPDPTIRAVGVGGAVTGSRPNVLIKDDLTTFAAANSETVMDEAIEWHKASRALLDKYEIESGLQSLEFIPMTRWAVYDLASYIMDNDPSVEVSPPEYRKIINDGKILWPEKYSLEDIDQLRNEHGSNFYLLYLNSAADPELTDFDMELVRSFILQGGMIMFDEDERDGVLEKRAQRKKETNEYGAPPPVAQPGTPLNEWLKRRMEQASSGQRGGRQGGWGVRLRG